jgi:hypothetical protein
MFPVVALIASRLPAPSVPAGARDAAEVRGGKASACGSRRRMVATARVTPCPLPRVAQQRDKAASSSQSLRQFRRVACPPSDLGVYVCGGCTSIAASSAENEAGERPGTASACVVQPGSEGAEGVKAEAGDAPATEGFWLQLLLTMLLSLGSVVGAACCVYAHAALWTHTHTHAHTRTHAQMDQRKRMPGRQTQARKHGRDRTKPVPCLAFSVWRN